MPPSTAATSAVWLLTSPRPHIVPRPADAVARAELHGFRLVDLDPARARGEPVGLPGDGAAVLAKEVHGPRPVIDARDPQLVALLDPEPLIGTVEGDDIARPVVGGERLLGIGVAFAD